VPRVSAFEALYRQHSTRLYNLASRMTACPSRCARWDARTARLAAGRGTSNRAIRGSYGDASAILEVRSHSGSVVITKK